MGQDPQPDLNLGATPPPGHFFRISFPGTTNGVMIRVQLRRKGRFLSRLVDEQSLPHYTQEAGKYGLHGPTLKAMFCAEVLLRRYANQSSWPPDTQDIYDVYKDAHGRFRPRR